MAVEADMWYNSEMSDIVATVFACIDIAIWAMYPFYIAVKGSRHAN